MTTEDKRAEAELDALFDAARATPPDLPEGLMARVVADAQAAQPAPMRSGWGAWLGSLGGLPGLGGLITASCFGFWLGVAPPAALPDLAGSVLGMQSGLLDDGFDGDTLTGFGWDLEEG